MVPGDRRMPLDGIVTKLHGFEWPPFRLSCRWSDWLAANDKEGLREVSPDGTVTVVRLDPLSKRNIKDILAKNYGVEDADAFVAAARQLGVGRLLNNPQNLKLVAKSVAGGGSGRTLAGRRSSRPAGCLCSSRTESTARQNHRPPPRIRSSRLRAALRGLTAGRQCGLHTSGPCGAGRRLSFPGEGRRRFAGRRMAGSGDAAVRGRVTILPHRLARDMHRIVEGIVEQLTILPGSEVSLPVEIDAEVPSDLNYAKVRTLVENGNTIGFVEKKMK